MISIQTNFQLTITLGMEGGHKHSQEHNSVTICIGLTESDSKLYTNFKFSEGKNHEHLKNTLIYNKSPHVLEDNASSL